MKKIIGYISAAAALIFGFLCTLLHIKTKKIEKQEEQITELKEEAAAEQKKVEVVETKQEVINDYNEKRVEIKEETVNKIEEIKEQIEENKIDEMEAYNNLIKEWNNK